MRKLELKIETCGGCPYCHMSDNNDSGYHCIQLWEGGTEQMVEYDELFNICPLPLYIEGQKELF